MPTSDVNASAASPDSASLPTDAIEVGYILDAWGVKGWFKIVPHASAPEALFSSRRWYLQPPLRGVGPVQAPKTLSALPTLLKITQVKEHGDGVVASAQDITERSEAEALKGARVFVSRASFPTAAEDEYYWVDLIGLQVVNREHVLLGTVQDLIDTGAHSILRIATGTGRPAERLIPFVGAYIDRVDLPAQRIEVDWNPAWDLDQEVQQHE